jgi:hypothetical protein
MRRGSLRQRMRVPTQWRYKAQHAYESLDYDHTESQVELECALRWPVPGTAH